MITKDEIEAKAEEFGLHAANIERDYVFGWLLAGIYETSPLKNILVLKGGNCFRKAYFPHTRFSNDLDFSCISAIVESDLASELNRICDFVEARTGITFEKDRNWVREKGNSDKERRIYEARLYFRDFYGNPHTTTISVHLDVTEFDRIFLPIQERFLVHPYSDSGHCKATIRCHQLEELLAAKLKCLLQRRHSFDLYDYVYSVFINRDIEVNREQLLRTFLRKTIFEPSPGVAKGLLLDLPLETFRGIWHKYIVCPVQSLLDFDTAIARFKENIEAVFAGLRLDYYGQIAFYPSHLRNMIMEAASNLMLLEITYDGRRRLIEPYSLVFKRRQDGFGQEYFYAYDQTGAARPAPESRRFCIPRFSRFGTPTRPLRHDSPSSWARLGSSRPRTILEGALV